MLGILFAVLVFSEYRVFNAGAYRQHANAIARPTHRKVSCSLSNTPLADDLFTVIYVVIVYLALYGETPVCCHACVFFYVLVYSE